jgi:hypothetical protein
MINKKDLTSIIFFDIETTSQYPSLDNLKLNNEPLYKLWIKRTEYLRAKFEENRELSDSELYLKKSGLSAEFNKIICITFGRLEYSQESDSFKFVLKTYSNHDEKQLLIDSSVAFTKFNKFKYCGHNIKRFDIPVLGKRYLINGLSVPEIISKASIAKPWELPYIDTSDLWSFGAWQEGFASLELIAECLDLPSPKEDLRGDQVTEVYWSTKDLAKISNYCEKDVETLMRILIKLSELS